MTTYDTYILINEIISNSNICLIFIFFYLPIQEHLMTFSIIKKNLITFFYIYML